MRIFIKDKKEIRTVTLRERCDGHLSADMFDDVIGPVYRLVYPINSDIGRITGATAEMTEIQFVEEMNWLEDACRSYNNHDPHSWFVVDLEDDEIEEEFERDAKLFLFYDIVEEYYDNE